MRSIASLFLRNRRIGIDISESYIKFVRLERGARGLGVAEFGERAYADEHGLATALGALKKKHGISSARVAVFAAETELPFSVEKACAAAGIVVRSLDGEAESAAHAAVHAGDTLPRIVVDIRDGHAGLCLFWRGTSYFETLIPYAGGRAVTEAVAESLNVPFADAEAAKIAHGLHQELGAGLGAAFAVAGYLRDEIAACMREWHGRGGAGAPPRPPIASIVLTGGGANLKGLPEFLASGLSLPVIRADVWRNLAFPERGVPALAKNESLRYAAAIGAALSN